MTETVYFIDISHLEDITQLCRLCLRNTKDKQDLYEEIQQFQDSTTSLFHELQFFTFKKLSNDPRYPSYLCSECLSLISVTRKIKLQMELTQAKLEEYFNESESTIPNTNATVELISNKGKFSLKDVVIIEEKNKDNVNYDGFLKNLGSVITAKFISKDEETNKKCIQPSEHIVNIVPVLAQNTVEQHVDVDESPRVESPIDEEPQKPVTFDCEECDTKFPKKRQLTRHIITQHRKYTCNICGQETNGQYSLNKHKRINHSERPYECDFCSKKFPTASNLRQHKVLHTNERSHLCPICGKNFNYANALKYHLRTHTGEKQYLCTYCPQVFSMQCALTRHIRVHTGLRPYKCSYCEKAFRSKGELCCHEYTHTGFRPYQCKICRKGFTKSHNLKLHMLGHEGPHMCHFCGRGFVENTYLKMHMKATHKITEDFDIEDDFPDTFAEAIDDAFIEDAEQILLRSEDSLIYTENIV